MIERVTLWTSGWAVELDVHMRVEFSKEENKRTNSMGVE
jgi:hypothetical protein